MRGTNTEAEMGVQREVVALLTELAALEPGMADELSDETLDLAMRLMNLAALRGAEGAHNEAIAMTREACAMFERCAGPRPADTVWVARARETLVEQYLAAGRGDDALAAQRASVDAHRAVARHDTAHLPDVGRVCLNLAVRLAGRGDHREAVNEARRGAAICREAGPDHLGNVVRCLASAATWAAEGGDAPAARAALGEAEALIGGRRTPEGVAQMLDHARDVLEGRA